MNYHRQKIEILVNRDSPIWAKIEARAAADGVSVEAVIEAALNLKVAVAVEEFLKL